MRCAYPVVLLSAFSVIAVGPPRSEAQTCFRTCLSSRITQSDITDDMIRYQMTLCREACDEASRARLVELRLDRKIAACNPQPVSDAEFKMVRAASASFFTYANAFTWDVHNVLPGKVIRKVEIIYPTLDLDETTATGGGTVLPGETDTILINGTFEGYPAMRYALRVRAIYACPID